jgi:hypothetical protein
MDYRAEMDTAIARFDQFAERHAGRPLGLRPRGRGRKAGTPALARKIATIAIVLAVLFAITVGVGLALDGIGLTGLFIAAALMLGAILLIGFKPTPAARPVAPYREDMPNRAVVRRLQTLLARHSAGLPAPAAQRAQAIAAQLPMLESQVAELDPLDPLAQEARRLAGQHLPELIERYERVPPQYRRERDGDGMSVDERLVSGLDAARVAIDDLGRRLSKQEVDEFQTQGRFLESRYREDGLGTGSAS